LPSAEALPSVFYLALGKAFFTECHYLYITNITIMLEEGYGITWVENKRYLF
jgi:hypothetical protein